MTARCIRSEEKDTDRKQRGTFRRADEVGHCGLQIYSHPIPTPFPEVLALASQNLSSLNVREVQGAPFRGRTLNQSFLGGFTGPLPLLFLALLGRGAGLLGRTLQHAHNIRFRAGSKLLPDNRGAKCVSFLRR